MVKAAKGDVDLLQDIWLDCRKRIVKFDPERGAITTFVSRMIKHKWCRYRFESNLIRIPLTQNDSTKIYMKRALKIRNNIFERESYDEEIEDNLSKEWKWLHEAIDKLSIRERYILRMKLAGYNFRQIGLKIDVLLGYKLTRERVRQLYERSLERMREDLLSIKRNV